MGPKLLGYALTDDGRYYLAMAPDTGELVVNPTPKARVLVTKTLNRRRKRFVRDLEALTPSQLEVARQFLPDWEGSFEELLVLARSFGAETEGL